MDKLGPYHLNSIVTGDARELAREIPDESVDLIFTDPVYDRIDDYLWLAETAERVLKPSGNLVMYQAHLYLPDTFCALKESALSFRWLIFDHKIGTQSSVFGARVLSRTRAAMVYYKPPLSKDWIVDFVPSYPVGDEVNHQWSKNPSATINWLSSLEADITLDPFAGGGTVPAVCKMLGRRYLAFEIDPATADNARLRVQNTQPPLFVLQPEQMELEID